MKAVLMLIMVLFISCGPPQPVPRTTAQGGGNAGKRIAAYCVSRSGQRVGDGECWTLADQAFRASDTHRPGGDPRVWGRRVDRTKESLLPGDVIEFEKATFSDGTMTGRAHTAVVVKGGQQTRIQIAEQNWGRKTVHLREIDLRSLRSGRISVFRPE